MPVVEHKKEQIGWRVLQQPIALLYQLLLQPLSHLDAIAGNLEVEVVAQERIKLQRAAPSLGKQGAVALDLGKEVADNPRAGDDHRLTKHGPALSPANVEGVTQTCDILQRNIRPGRRQTVSDACTVEVEP